ncbi:hypothetical protein RND71_007512 [Anisodus tanguticus]|uniref:Uncharacterized protein n=1 Tax=Anisodus tanguticus TaxID=243964 RepID=A0AAE1VJ72_9SOLA|nr:hypothetical protein RND71_007512 [Anisodus tanguticus]
MFKRLRHTCQYKVDDMKVVGASIRTGLGLTRTIQQQQQQQQPQCNPTSRIW